MKDLNWQIKKRAVWIAHNTKWTYDRALTALKASIIEQLQNTEYPILMTINTYYVADFGEGLPFDDEKYEDDFLPFK